MAQLYEEFFVKTVVVFWEALMSLLLGTVGGGICGAVILTFNGLIGRSGSTGDEYWGYFEIAGILVGSVYGGIFGAFAGPIAYALVVRKTGFRVALLPAFVGTIAGGFAGAFAGPGTAVITGISGFFVGVLWAGIKRARLNRASVPD